MAWCNTYNVVHPRHCLFIKLVVEELAFFFFSRYDELDLFVEFKGLDQ